MKKKKMFEISESNRGITWSIKGWTVKAETILDAMRADVSYHQCLAYKLFELAFDQDHNREHCLEQLKDDLEREPEEDELNKYCWDQEDFEWGCFFDEIQAAKSDQEVMELSGLGEDDVLLESVECQSGSCHMDLDPSLACPGCSQVFCDGHYDEDRECPGCGYVRSSMDLMHESVVE